MKQCNKGIQGLLLSKEDNIEDLVALEDSHLAIQHFVHESILKDCKLWIIIDRIRNLKLAISSIKFFHVLRMNYFPIDDLANKGENLEVGVLMRNGILSLTTIPYQWVWY